MPQFLPATMPGAPAPPGDVQGLLECFAPITLEQMGGVSLLDRRDAKYLLHEYDLPAILASLTNSYRVLDIAARREHSYETVYFDTAEFRLYLAHHQGRPERYKVRNRRYRDSGDCFLEVKRRTKQARTLKSRERIDGQLTVLAPEASALLAGAVPLDVETLAPSLYNRFRRITLVDLRRGERVTIDRDLEFQAPGRKVRLPGVVVAEVKEAGHRRNSAFVAEMRARNLHPTAFSKYCIGVARLCPQVKHNRFKRELLLLEKVMRRQSSVC